MITDHIFLKPLENHISGYSWVSAHAMIQFLFDAYDNITPLQLGANGKIIKEHWDPSSPIIYLFSKMEFTRQMLATHCTRSIKYWPRHSTMFFVRASHIVRMSDGPPSPKRTKYGPTSKTCLLRPTRCTNIYQHIQGGIMVQTWPRLATTMLPPAQAESFYTETADAFAKLAMATTADKDLISTFTSTNAALTGQLATKYRLIANLQTQIHNTTTNTNTDRPNT
jgi:hypothetical protein